MQEREYAILVDGVPSFRVRAMDISKAIKKAKEISKDLKDRQVSAQLTGM